MEKASEDPQGGVENGVTRIYVCPLILLINNSTQIYYAARPNSSTSSPSPLFVTKHPHKIPKLNLTPIKNQETAHGIPCSSWSQRTQIQTTKHRKQ